MIRRRTPSRTSPLFAAAALVGAGLVLRQWRPSSLDLPTKKNRPHIDRGRKRQVRKVRDGMLGFLPANTVESLGNSLVTAGIGIAVLRALDELVDDTERLF